MIAVSFLAADGRLLAAAQADPGARLLDVAQAAGMDLEGTCNGLMACSTCHVIIPPPFSAQLPPPTAEEDDLLDLTPNAGPGSRLACQIRVDVALHVRMPR